MILNHFCSKPMKAPSAITSIIETFQDSSVTVIEDSLGNIWLRATSVCEKLEFTNAYRAVNTHCKDHQYQEFRSGNGRPSLYVNEAGFYRLVLKSKSAIAEEFIDWLTEFAIPKLKASRTNSTPVDVASFIESATQEMSDRLNHLLDIERSKVAALEASLASLAPIYKDPFPYSVQDLQDASGIRSLNYIRNVIRLNFKVDSDYLGFRYGDGKITQKQISDSTYNILCLCFRSYDGVDLTKLPDLIQVEKDKYFQLIKPRAKNKLIQHPDQLSLF